MRGESLDSSSVRIISDSPSPSAVSIGPANISLCASSSSSEDSLQFTSDQCRIPAVTCPRLSIKKGKEKSLLALLGTLAVENDPLGHDGFYKYPSVNFYVDTVYSLASKAIEGSMGPRREMTDVYTRAAMQCDPSAYSIHDASLRAHLEATYPLLSTVPQRSTAYLEPMLLAGMGKHLNVPARLCVTPLGDGKGVDPNRNNYIHRKNPKISTKHIKIGNKVHVFENVEVIPRFSDSTLLSRTCMNVGKGTQGVILTYTCPICSMQLDVDRAVNTVLARCGFSVFECSCSGTKCLFSSTHLHTNQSTADIELDLDLELTDFQKHKNMTPTVYEAVLCLRLFITSQFRNYFCHHLAKEKLRLQGILNPSEIMEGRYRTVFSEVKRRVLTDAFSYDQTTSS